MRIILLVLVAWVIGLGSYLLYDRFWPGHTGSIVVTSDPPGAEIWLDLAPLGRTTPAELRDVPAGKRSVTVRLDGRRPQPFVEVVKVARGTRDSLSFVFDGNITPSAKYDTPRSQSVDPLIPPRLESITEKVKREQPWEVERRIPTSVDSSILTRVSPSGKLEPVPLTTAEPGPVRDIPAQTEPATGNSPATGTAEISSSVAGAQIVINDKEIPQRTPAVVSLPLGTHTVRVEMPGYTSDPQQQIVRLSRAAGAQLVYFTLTEQQRARKEITITTEPVAGPIFVNGDSIGSGLVVFPHDFGVYEISFGKVDGYLTPESQRLVVTPAKPNPAVTVTYPRAFAVSAVCRAGGSVDTEGQIRWETGIFDRDKGARISETHGPRIDEIPGSSKSGWELAMGDPNRNPTGADYIEFFFTLPDEVPTSTPLNLRLYLYRTNRKYPLSLSNRCEVTVTVNGRVFLDNFRPRHDQSLADSERYEEWSLQHSLVPGENRIMIRTGDKNQIFNYLWKFEVL